MGSMANVMKKPPTHQEVSALFTTIRGTDTGHVASVTFPRAYTVFSEGETVTFDAQVTVLVGDQGTGKSTLLRSIRHIADERLAATNRHYLCDDTTYRVVDLVGSPTIRYFDTAKGPASGDDVSTRLDMWGVAKSHGERLLPVVEFLDTISNGVILLDEPEAALSPRSVVKLTAALRRAVERGCQVVIATHHPDIIRKLTDVVFSMETRSWMTGEDYLQSCGC